MNTDTEGAVAAQALPELPEEDTIVYEALRTGGADKLLAYNATQRIRAMAAADAVAAVGTMREELKSFKEEVRHRFVAASDGLMAFKDATHDRLAGAREEMRSLKEEMKSFKEDVRRRFKEIEEDLRSFKAEVRDRFERIEEDLRSFKAEVRDRFERIEGEMRSFKAEVRDRFERIEGEMRGGFESATRDRDSLRGLIRGLSQKIDSMEALSEARHDSTQKELSTVKWALSLVIAMLAVLIALAAPMVRSQNVSPAIPAPASAVGMEQPAGAGNSASLGASAGPAQSGPNGETAPAAEPERTGQ